MKTKTYYLALLYSFLIPLVLFAQSSPETICGDDNRVSTIDKPLEE